MSKELVMMGMIEKLRTKVGILEMALAEQQTINEIMKKQLEQTQEIPREDVDQ